MVLLLDRERISVYFNKLFRFGPGGFLVFLIAGETKKRSWARRLLVEIPCEEFVSGAICLFDLKTDSVC